MQMCADPFLARYHVMLAGSQVSYAGVYARNVGNDSDGASAASTHGDQSVSTASTSSDHREDVRALQIEELSKALQEKTLLVEHLQQRSLASPALDHTHPSSVPAVLHHVPHVPQVPLLPLRAERDDLLASAIQEMSKTMRDNAKRQNSGVGNAETVKFAVYKNAGDGPDKTRVGEIVWQWETDFEACDLDPSVPRVL